MKVRPSVKPICEKSKIIKRKGRVMVPRAPPRQGLANGPKARRYTKESATLDNFIRLFERFRAQRYGLRQAVIAPPDILEICSTVCGAGF